MFGFQLYSTGCLPDCVNGVVDPALYRFGADFMEAVVAMAFGTTPQCRTTLTIWTALGHRMMSAIQQLNNSTQPTLPQPQTSLVQMGDGDGDDDEKEAGNRVAAAVSGPAMPTPPHIAFPGGAGGGQARGPAAVRPPTPQCIASLLLQLPPERDAHPTEDPTVKPSTPQCIVSLSPQLPSKPDVHSTDAATTPPTTPASDPGPTGTHASTAQGQFPPPQSEMARVPADDCARDEPAASPCSVATPPPSKAVVPQEPSDPVQQPPPSDTAAKSHLASSGTDDVSHSSGEGQTSLPPPQSPHTPHMDVADVELPAVLQQRLFDGSDLSDLDEECAHRSKLSSDEASDPVHCGISTLSGKRRKVEDALKKLSGGTRTVKRKRQVMCSALNCIFTPTNTNTPGSRIAANPQTQGQNLARAKILLGPHQVARTQALHSVAEV